MNFIVIALCFVSAFVAADADLASEYADYCANGPPRACTYEYSPVCGSDGQSYATLCTMASRTCQLRSNIRPLYRGECDNNRNKRSTGSNAERMFAWVNRKYDQYVRRCQPGRPLQCTRERGFAVCGSDSETYANVCALADAACREDGNIRPSSVGQCQTREKRSTGDRWAAVMRMFDVAQQRCLSNPSRRSICPAISLPVCASDGRTYPSPCHVGYVNCQDGSTVVQSIGRC